MKCLICKKEMVLRGEDLTTGKDDKKYNRTIYNCEDCDTWISVEIPIDED